MSRVNPQSIRNEMRLRPNPTMTLHGELANRWVLHIDLFAYRNRTSPNMILFAVEYRRGGRACDRYPVIRHYYRARIGQLEAPSRAAHWHWRHYSETDVHRFAGEEYAWAVYMHHRYLKHRARERREDGVRHVSFMAHYFPIGDHDPHKGFVNWSRRDGKRGTYLTMREIAQYEWANRGILTADRAYRKKR